MDTEQVEISQVEQSIQQNQPQETIIKQEEHIEEIHKEQNDDEQEDKIEEKEEKPKEPEQRKNISFELYPAPEEKIKLTFTTEEEMINYISSTKIIYDKITKKYDERHKIDFGEGFDFDNLTQEQIEDTKQKIGEKIYEKIMEMFDDDEARWGKLTGMLIESIELKELNNIISSDKLLTEKILEANKFYNEHVNLLENQETPQEQQQEQQEQKENEDKEKKEEKEEQKEENGELREDENEKIIIPELPKVCDEKTHENISDDVIDEDEEKKETKEKYKYTEEDINKIRDFKFDLQKIPEDNVSAFLKIIKPFQKPIPVKYLTFFLYQYINTNKRKKTNAFKFYEYILECFIEEVIRVIEENLRFNALDFLINTLIYEDEDGDKCIKYCNCVNFMVQSVYFKQLAGSTEFINEIDDIEAVMVDKVNKKNQHQKYSY